MKMLCDSVRMRNVCRWICRALLVVIPWSVDAAGSHAADATNGERLFTLKVLPLLKVKCFGCHGDDAGDVRGGFNMLSRAGLLKGGESGEASIVPGRAAESPLFRAILWDGYEMPPKENDRLTDGQIEIVREWIDSGAPWPASELQNLIRSVERAVKVNIDGELVETSGGLSDEWTWRRYQPDDLWAFRRVRSKHELIDETLSATDAIDHFISRRLDDAGLTPSGQASPRALLRRAALDLTGLPPAPEEIDQFEADFADDPERAWQSVVDRLLASPRYGEHWGRHWLDVTRYADTGGMSNDYERSNMWRYRDYVIRAFNSDKPYDQFVIEQLAGDELADQSVHDRKGAGSVERTQLDGDYTPEEAEWIVATGFLRLGPWDNAMVEPAEARQMYLDDLVNITGQTFLGQTLRCCKCHDHKFDPVPTRDYYRVYAAFAATHMAERNVPFLPDENQEGFDSGRAHVQRMLDYAVAEKDRLIEKREAAARAWFAEHDLPYRDEDARKDLPDDQKPERHVGLDHVEQGQLKVREQDEWIWTRQLERYEPMAQSVFNASDSQMAWNGARKLRINRRIQLTAGPLVSHILLGGALTATGDETQPGVLSAVGLETGFSAEQPWLVTSDIDGRRLQLAKWIAHPENGLATRAVVNRIWQYHFGTALAANGNNLGAKGARPSHPDLLDWLAADFVENGWRIKRLHRAIMLSEAYRRSTVAAEPEVVAKTDPDNRLLSFFPRRRLSAEELRDGMLSITGELRTATGGVPARPEINMEVALEPRMIQFSLAPAYQPSRTPDERNRRTVFAYHIRGQADPFTELFNQPNPNESCELRESASVTPQVFALLNSDILTDRSIALAVRLQNERGDVSQQIDRAFRLVLGRHVTESESSRLNQYVLEMQKYHRDTTPPDVLYPKEIVRSLVEEFSGDVFEYTEILPVFERYVPDRKPADVSDETRALADLCLLLFNTNEFMYVE